MKKIYYLNLLILFFLFTGCGAYLKRECVRWTYITVYENKCQRYENNNCASWTQVPKNKRECAEYRCRYPEYVEENGKCVKRKSKYYK